MKRRDLTGSVASVTGEALAKNPVSNIAEALQGQLPGVNVISQDGRPGATMSIRVRGGGSITQSNEPLYVVDGMPVDRIDDIPADNIESIDVLKDAASTAIYGARGANGVILITTKNAKAGKAIVKYSTYYQLRPAPEQLDVQSAYEHVMHNWGYATAYGETYGDGVARYYGLGSKYGNHINEYKNVEAHNYMDDVLRTGNMWNNDLTISGGTERTKYMATASYMSNKGNLVNSGFRRWNINLKLQQELTRNLTLDLNARYTEMQFKGHRYNYATEAYRYRPIDNPLGSGDPTDLGMGSASVEENYNPVSIVNDADNLRDVYRLNLTSGLTWKVIKGLTAKTELTVARRWTKTQNWDGGHFGDSGYSSAALTTGDGYNVRWTSTLTYDVQGLGEDHNLNVMAGNEVLGSKTTSASINGYGYPSEWNMEQAFGNIHVTDKSLGRDKFSTNFGEPSHTQSWFGRINYSYLGRYLITATMRADGSSRFAKGNQWGYFPAGAVAWRLSDEPFMEGTRSWLDNLKIRASIGTSGNDGIDGSSFFTAWVSATENVNGQQVTVYKPGSLLGNPDLKWETTISRNAGIDYSFFNGKINGALDFYWNTTKDCLMRVPCDPTSGFSYQYQNVAQTSNKGFELSLNYNAIRTKDFSLRFGLTYNFNHNNVDEVAENAIASAHTNWGSTMRLPNYDYVIEEGKPVGVIQGFKSNGFYTVDDFNVANGVWTLKEGVADNQVGNWSGGSYYNIPKGQTAFPGMVKFQDTDGSGVVTVDDVTELGIATAKHTGGFNFTASYKGIDLSANFNYQIGGKVYNANVMHSMMGDKDTGLGYNRLAEVSECWKMFNVNSSGDIYAVTDPTELAALNANAKYALPYSEYGIVNSEFIEDASFLRLQTLTIGYTFPKSIIKYVGVSNIRVYFTGGNLFCLKGYSGLDPDVNVSPSADSSYSGFPTPNYDFRSYPKSRTFTFGLNVTF
jgi:TonB-linked SusC/RagA family outer membrane protein